MSVRYLGAIGLSGIVAALGVLALAPVSAQQSPAKAGNAAPATGAYKVPRLPNGQPDLTGVWANNSVTPMQRPKELGTRQYLTNEEMIRLKSRAETLFAGDGDAAFGDEIFAAALSDRTKYVADSFDKDTGNYNSYWLVGRVFDNRTSLIVDPPDGRKPPLTPAAAKRAADLEAARKQRGFVADSHEDRPLSERCITFGLPDAFAGYNSYFQITQSDKWVAISNERIHDTRVIPMDGRPHVSKDVRLMLGDSRGRWDGDTLVVDTTNFTANSGSQGSDENLHMIERFTRTAADTVEYQVTLEDPTVWTAPWTFMIPLKFTTDKIYEYACHEGNTGLFGVLGGARAQERAAAGAAAATAK
jgi:hypothetical protein